MYWFIGVLLTLTTITLTGAEEILHQEESAYFPLVDSRDNQELDNFQRAVSDYLSTQTTLQTSRFDKSQISYLYVRGNASIEYFNSDDFVVLDFDLHSDESMLDILFAHIQGTQPDMICIQDIKDTHMAYAIYEFLKDRYSHFYLEIDKQTSGSLFNNLIASKGALTQPVFRPFVDENMEINNVLLCQSLTHNHQKVRAGTKYNWETSASAESPSIVTQIYKTYAPKISREQLACRGNGGRGHDAGFNNGQEKRERDQDTGRCRDRDRTADSDSRSSVGGGLKVDQDRMNANAYYEYRERDNEGRDTSWTARGEGSIDAHGNKEYSAEIRFDKDL